MYDFSIIIPVYNVENHLKECLESILSQSYTNYEIILVDDGSTDGSGKICDSYAREYHNIRVYHQKNRGQSVARNLAVEKASGEYLWFVDSDDIVLYKNALQQLSFEIKEKPDVISFGWKEADSIEKFSESKEKFNFNRTEQKKYTGEDYLKSSLKEKKLYQWYPWVYVYRRSYWQNKKFQFPTGKKFEDVKLIYRTLLEASTVKKHKKALYGYRINRKGSTTTSVNMNTLVDGMVVIAENINEIESNSQIDEELKHRLANNFSCTYFALIILSTKLSKKEITNFLNVAKQYYWVTNYTTQIPQKIVKIAIDMLGISVVQSLLGVRRILKNKN